MGALKIIHRYEASLKNLLFAARSYYCLISCNWPASVFTQDLCPSSIEPSSTRWVPLKRRRQRTRRTRNIGAVEVKLRPTRRAGGQMMTERSAEKRNTRSTIERARRGRRRRTRRRRKARRRRTLDKWRCPLEVFSPSTFTC